MKTKTILNAILLLLLLGGRLMAQLPTYDYCSPFSSTGGGTGYSVAYDKLGNSYVTGNFKGVTDLDPSASNYTVTANGQGIFLAKYNSTGQFQWGFSLGKNASVNNGYSLKCDSMNNVYLAGSLIDTADFDPSVSGTALLGSPSSGACGFLAKYNSQGQYQWAFMIKGTVNSISYIVGMDMDINNNLCVIGSYKNACNFGGVSSTSIYTSSPNNSFNSFIAKYDFNGQNQWVKTFNGGQNLNIKQLDIDANNNINCVGQFYGITDFDPSANSYTINSGGMYANGFYSKYDQNGQLIFAKNIAELQSSGNAVQLSSIGMDFNGNAYIVGNLQGLVDFDPSSNMDTLKSITYLPDAFVVKYNNLGQLVWARQFGGAKDDYCNSISVADNGDFWITGIITQTVDMDFSSTVVNIASTGTISDLYVANYDSNAQLKWVFNSSSNFGSSGQATNVDYLNGKIYLTGTISQQADMDPSIGTTPFPIGYKLFLAKYSYSTVGTKEESITKEGFLYPNPANDFFSVSTTGNSSVRVVNALGQIVLVRNLSKDENKVDVSDLKSGVYIIYFNDKSTSRAFKLIKQ